MRSQLVCLALLGFVLTGCAAPAPHAVPDAAVVGAWRSADGQYWLDVFPNGNYVVEAPQASPVPLTSTWGRLDGELYFFWPTQLLPGPYPEADNARRVTWAAEDRMILANSSGQAQILHRLPPTPDASMLHGRWRLRPGHGQDVAWIDLRPEGLVIISNLGGHQETQGYQVDRHRIRIGDEHLVVQSLTSETMVWVSSDGTGYVMDRMTDPAEPTNDRD